MSMVELRIEAFLCDVQFAGINDNNRIAHINTGRIGWFVLPDQIAADPGSESSQALIGGVH